MEDLARKRLKNGHYHLVLDGERPTSLNKFYTGMNMHARRRLAKRVHDLVLVAARTQLSKPVKPISPALVLVTAYFDKRPYDPDNVAAKPYIDGLVHAGLLAGDSPKHIHEVRLRSRIDRERPRTEIEVWQV